MYRCHKKYRRSVRCSSTSHVVRTFRSYELRHESYVPGDELTLKWRFLHTILYTGDIPVRNGIHSKIEAEI